MLGGSGGGTGSFSSEDASESSEQKKLQFQLKQQITQFLVVKRPFTRHTNKCTRVWKAGGISSGLQLTLLTEHLVVVGVQKTRY